MFLAILKYKLLKKKVCLCFLASNDDFSNYSFKELKMHLREQLLTDFDEQNRKFKSKQRKIYLI